MNRLRDLLATRNDRKLMVPFFTVGYPGYKASLDLIKTGINAGADIIELGMPFSDPMADGPEIQRSSQIALNRGISIHKVLDAVSDIRRHSDIPLVLMGYYNPVLKYRPERFARDLETAGGDGLIIPDLPFDESGPLADPARKHDLSMIYLVSPTSSAARVKRIDAASTDLVYAVTVTGVTGGRTGYSQATDRYLASLAGSLKKPFVAGFGVSSPKSAKRLARHADGVVIGSALIRTFREARNRTAGNRAVARLLRGIRRAL